MLNVLIVDDDNLVRQGLKLTIPWEKYNMQVIGDAKNGKKALEFLAEHTVHIMITDLAMPVMSGIDLLKVVSERYPHIYSVVLTLHQDFEYIQEVLRMGAIDYIAKVQLEEDGYEKILERISNHIQKQPRSLPTLEPKSERMMEDELLIWYARSQYSLWEHLHLTDIQDIKRFEYGFICFRTDKAIMEQITRSISTQLTQSLYDRSRFIIVRNVKDVLKATLFQWITHFITDEFFYYYTKNEPHAIIYCQYTDKQQPSYVLEELIDQHRMLCWLDEAVTMEEKLTDLYELKPQKADILELSMMLYTEWNEIYYSLLSKHIPLPRNIEGWQQFIEWLEDVRGQFIANFNKSAHSKEVQHSIALAIDYIHHHYSEPISSSTLSAYVHMSRSYFSQIFKEIVGQTFNDYLRYIRIEKAKQYLLHTNQTIQFIAEQVGYSDEKYFSQIFKGLTDKLPSEFRGKKQR